MYSQMKSPYILSDEFYLTFSVKKVKSHTSQGDPHEPEPNRVSVARKKLRVLLLPLEWDASPSQGYSQQYGGGTHLQT